ncbi:MAG: SDR family NAD(P)-dependent oxidoreductase, partial [Verrucomicrobiota bacterium]
MNESKLHRCAVITGASAGLGTEFARQLASCVETLVLVARREGRLEELADELRREHAGLKVGVIVADLTKSEDRSRVVSKISDAGLLPDLLINNAGMGDYGEFSEARWPKLESMIRLNIEALTHLSHAMLPAMKQGGGGS